MREGKRWGIEATDTEVEQQLLQHGAPDGAIGRAIDPEPRPRRASTPARSKRRIRADIVWQQLVRGRYQSRLQLSRQGGASAARSEEARGARRRRLRLHSCGRSCSWCRRAPRPRPMTAAAAKPRRCERRFKGCNESIPAVRAMQRRRRARPGHPLLGRSSGRPAQGPRQRAAGRIDRRPKSPGTASRCLRSARRTKPRPIRPAAARRARRSRRSGSTQESKKYLRQLRKNAMIEPGK